MKWKLKTCVLLTLAACDTKGDDTSSDGSAGNAVPTTPVVELSPAIATSADDITVTISQESEDADGDAITYEYVWLRNGEVVEGLTGPTLPASETTKGEPWTVEVYPSDGTDQGLAGRASTTIKNGAPAVTVFLSPEEPGTNDMLSVSFETTDSDSDTVDVTWDWLVNGTQINPVEDSIDGVLWFDKGDTVTVRAFARDGSTVTVGEGSIVIGNTAPSAPEISLSPTPPIVSSNLICRVDVPGEDVDPEDEVSYAFSWTVDGAPYTGAATTTVWPGDTISGADVIVDQEWICSAVSTDGTDSSASVSTDPGIVIPWQGPRLFTSCAVAGAIGPEQADCDVDYVGSTLEGEVAVSAGIQEWTVPFSGDYTIEACGAQGSSGTTSYVGGWGACLSGVFSLIGGETLYIAIGQQGTGSTGDSGGGGGGSFVVQADDTPLIIAGGGGGIRASASIDGCAGVAGEYGVSGSASSSTSSCTVKTSSLGEGGTASSSSWGSGGAGFNSNGGADSTYGAVSYSWFEGLNGGQATYSCGGVSDGGFGGGGTGQGCRGGGGGGGYSGGDGGWIGGGGGSYSGGTDTAGTDGANEGDGYVIIDYGTGS